VIVRWVEARARGAGAIVARSLATYTALLAALADAGVTVSADGRVMGRDGVTLGRLTVET